MNPTRHDAQIEVSQFSQKWFIIWKIDIIIIIL